MKENSADSISILSVAKDEHSAIKDVLDTLTATVDLGGEFNKFDKRTRNKHSDGLYILDIIWKLRQMKKENV